MIFSRHNALSLSRVHLCTRLSYLRTIRYGFAAGCEAGLRPAGAAQVKQGGFAPVRAWPVNLYGQRPYQGHSPNFL